MPLLSATASRTGDPIALAMVVALLILVAIALLRKRFGKKSEPVAPAQSVTPVQSAPLAPGSAGNVKLHDVEPKTAAMLMAIVADKLGKPLNELRFLSIKEVKEK